MNVEIVSRALAMGVGATLVMDGWLLLLQRLGVPVANFALLGRWLGHLFQGTWLRGGPAKARAIKGEAVLGWTAHYATGIAFAASLILIKGVEWARAPTFIPALVMGSVTVLAPLFVLQPAMGAGVASSKTAAPLLNSVKSLANHAVFGVGLYLAAVVSA